MMETASPLGLNAGRVEASLLLDLTCKAAEEALQAPLPVVQAFAAV